MNSSNTNLFTKKLLKNLGLGCFSLALGFSGLLGTAAVADEAENYPEKMIRFVVPYAPGGPLDAAARQLGERVQEILGQSVVVENKAGAGGNIGLTTVAQAKADGYVLGMGAVATMAINPWLYSNMPFDPAKDFAPVILLSNVPNVLILNKNFAAENNITDVKSLVAYLKETDADINYASGGNGSAGHLAGELFKIRTGTDALHVPYQGANPAKLSLMSNQTQIMFDNLASALPLIQTEDVLALAVTTSERSSFLADLPTMEESGVENFDIGTWFGVVSPTGTPEAVIEKLNLAYAEGMQDERVQTQMKNMGSDLAPGTAQDFADYAVAELAKYKDIVESAGVKLD